MNGEWFEVEDYTFADLPPQKQLKKTAAANDSREQ